MHPKLHVADDNAIDEAARAIRAGRLVAFTTETVYGLGADATNAQAVARVFAAKRRPKMDPLIVHVGRIAEARSLVTDWPPLAERLAKVFWPGPLTMVLPKSDIVPDLVTSGLPSVALRVPSHPLAQRLIRASGCPIAAPSANRFGRISPTRASHVVAELADQPDLAMVLDGGACEHGVESTVVRLGAGAGDVMHVLRLGGLPIEALSEHGQVQVVRASHDETKAKGVASPGMLERHYAPATQMTLAEDREALERELAVCQGQRVGVLCLNRDALGESLMSEKWEMFELSRSGDLIEAAANLFVTMRAMDAAGLGRLLALSLPERGLGRAINDRLARASQR